MIFRRTLILSLVAMATACVSVATDYAYAPTDDRALVFFALPGGRVELRGVDMANGQFTGDDVTISSAEMTYLHRPENGGRTFRASSNYGVDRVPPGDYLVSGDRWWRQHVFYSAAYTRCFEQRAAIVRIRPGVVNVLERPEMIADRVDPSSSVREQNLAALMRDADQLLAEYPSIQGERQAAEVLAIAHVVGATARNCGDGPTLEILWTAANPDAPFPPGPKS